MTISIWRAALTSHSYGKRIPTSQKTAELHDLVITGLSYLVSANCESGFKKCLPLAYDQDGQKRMVFAHVFARVIGQGTVFTVKDKSILKPRFQELCDVSEIPFPLLLSTDNCPAGSWF